jgi:putative colanic acid biosynthesis acetyltransferase WcaF
MILHPQDSPYHSPWTLNQRIKMVLWEYAWQLFCSWTPKPANRWRLLWLKLFGAKIYGKPFVHQRARIQIPWNLTLHDRAALGDRANAYSLDKIEIHEHATVAQEAYLCTGTHAFDQSSKNLVTAPIIIRAHVFIGARAFIMPGIEIGEQAIVGACSVVTKNVIPYTIVAGNPAHATSKHFFINQVNVETKSAYHVISP